MSAVSTMALVRVRDSCGRTKSENALCISASEGNDGTGAAVGVAVANAIPGTTRACASTIAAASAISADG
jgi:hypothetical protein